jgi:hypothetical protein
MLCFSLIDRIRYKLRVLMTLISDKNMKIETLSNVSLEK